MIELFHFDNALTFSLKFYQSNFIDETYQFTSYNSIKDTHEYLKTQQKYMYVGSQINKLKCFGSNTHLHERSTIITTEKPNTPTIETKRNHAHTFTLLLFPPKLFGTYKCIDISNKVSFHSIPLDALYNWTGILIEVGSEYSIEMIDASIKTVYVLKTVLNNTRRSFYEKINEVNNKHKINKMIDNDSFDKMNQEEFNPINSSEFTELTQLF